MYLYEIKPYTWDNFAFTIVPLCLWHFGYEILSVVHVVVNLLDFLIERRQKFISQRFRIYLLVYLSMLELKHPTV